MSTLRELKAPIQNDLKQFQKIFRGSAKSSVPLLNIIMKYVFKSKGKQIRPLIVIYSSKLFGKVSDKTHRAAALIELLHTATLVHDDIVDDSDKRRGRFSINALWKNKIAVLVGDYLLSRGMLVALQAKDYDTLEIVSDAVKEMSEGELLQIEKARKLDIDESIYYEIIRKKTASLLASCFAVGAAATSCSKDEVKQMWKIGEYLGMAFQIKDDIFDFEKTNIIGKPTGIDIKEKKMTLPLIYLINNSSPSAKRSIIRNIKNHSKNKKYTDKIIEEVRNCGGLEYASEKMREYTDMSLELLMEFPENESRRALEQLIEFSISRSD